MPQSVKPRPSLQQAIADELRALRQSRHLTQEEVGHRAGYDPIYINMLEKGRRNPSIRALFNICEALGSEPSFVLEEVERKTMFKARVVKSS